jgi:hypothetical protein
MDSWEGDAGSFSCDFNGQTFHGPSTGRFEVGGGEGQVVIVVVVVVAGSG